MALQTVKKKLNLCHILVGLALATFGVSFTGVIPQRAVEYGYSRRIFPMISHIAGLLADALPFSWLDIGIVASVPILMYILRRWRWIGLAGAVAVAYLVFFWTWGLNYHRIGLREKLGVVGRSASAEEMRRFTMAAASELNRLWPLVARDSAPESSVAATAASRISAVAFRLDGVHWTAARRVKHSWLVNPWFRIAGVEGVFNPIAHEPIVVSGLLPFEFPFVASHELAHGQGYPDEGDANMAALLATVASDDPLFQYSGWFYLWLYLRTPDANRLLDEGPRRDLELSDARVRSQQIPWVNKTQTVVLDSFLKANNVKEGVQSYSRFVEMALASQEQWDSYR